MISPIAFKFALVHMLPYIYFAANTKHPIRGENIYYTSQYSYIEAATSAETIRVEIGDWSQSTKYVRNRTHGFILVDLPSMVKLCKLFTAHAPEITCISPDVVNTDDLYSKLDVNLIRRGFGVPDFVYSSKSEMVKFMMSGQLDYDFLVQTFPSLAIKLKAPVIIKEGNDCGAQDCTQPRATDFFFDGIRDTAVGLAVHALGKKVIGPYIWRPYLQPLVHRYVHEPFKRWYHAALYNSGPMTARQFDAGLAASSDRITMSSLAREGHVSISMYESEVAPFIKQVGRAKHIISSSGSSGTIFRSPYSFTTPASLTSGSLRGVIASSRAINMRGLVRQDTIVRSVSAPELSIVPRSTRAFATTTLDVLVENMPRATSAITVPVVRSTLRSSLTALGTVRRLVRSTGQRCTSFTLEITTSNETLTQLGLWCGDHAQGQSSRVKRKAPSTPTTSPAPSTSSAPSTTPDAAAQNKTNVAQNKTSVTLGVTKTSCSGQLSSRQKLRCRRSPGRGVSYGVARSIQQVGELLARLPSWVGTGVRHTIVWATPWMFSAYFNLMPYDVDIHVIQPIQHLASYERFYIAASTLMFCQCFHNEEITSAVDKESNTNLRLTVSGRTFTDKDVVYNIRQGIPGDVLHRCSPFFHDKTTGLSQELLLEVLSVHFDTTFVLEGVLFYNGPAKYIINDYRAYFRDIYPLFSPTSSVPKSSDLYKVAEYNNDLRRSRRHKVVKRKTYTTTYHELGNKVKLNSESSYTSTIQALLQTPRLRYEFDLMSNTHYNTSFSYYKHLRQYVESDVLDFSKPIHHSGFSRLRS